MSSWIGSLQERSLVVFNTPETNSEPKREMSNTEAGAFAITLVGVLGGYWVNQNSSLVESLYFKNFEEIYLSAWAICWVLLLVGIYYLLKKTRNITKRSKLLAPLWNQASDKVMVGTTEDGIGLHLSDEQRCSHVQVIGTTGRGKTQSVVIPWAIRDLIRRKSVIILDGKGSLELPSTLQDEVDKLGINAKVINFVLDDQSGVVINPLESGTPQQITDRLFSIFEFDQSFYKSTQYDICGTLVRLICECEEEVSFRKIYDLLSDDKILADYIKKLGKHCESSFKNQLISYLKTPRKDRKKDTAGLTSQLAPLAIGEVSKLVNGGEGEVNLYDLLCEPSDDTYLYVISIPTLKYQKIGHQIGKAILQELTFCVGYRERLSHSDLEFTSVFLDEFSEFVYEEFVSILNKARSAKVALHLCHQSMGDLEKVSSDFALSVNTNTNIKCILGLNDPDTADFYARHFGTETGEKLTEQVEDQGYFSHSERTGRGSMREVEAYKVHPNILKKLYQGRGVLHLPTKNGPVTEVIQYAMINEQDALEVDHYQH
jgi:conjugal transfer pilus assembly protein TraD